VKALAVSALSLVALSALGCAQVPDENGVINACYKQDNGELRAVSEVAECDTQVEVPVTWNQEGPRGAPGPQGPAGADGDVQLFYDKKAAEVSINHTPGPSNPFGTFVEAGGPAITVDVPAGALVRVLVAVEGRLNVNTQPCAGNPPSTEPGKATAVVVEQGPGTSTFLQLEHLDPLDFGSAAYPARGRYYVTNTRLLGAAPGEHTYTVRYGVSAGCTAWFRNRELWVEVHAPGD
jgi:hypothetical protein